MDQSSSSTANPIQQREQRIVNQGQVGPDGTTVRLQDIIEMSNVIQMSRQPNAAVHSDQSPQVVADDQHRRWQQRWSTRCRCSGIHEMQSYEDKLKCYKMYSWINVFQIVVYAIFIGVYIEQMSKLRDSYKPIWQYIIRNMILLGFEVLFYTLICFYAMEMALTNYFVNVVQYMVVFFSIWGMFVAWSQPFQDVLDHAEPRNAYQEVLVMLSIMIWCRLIFVIVVFTSSLIQLFYFLRYFCSRAQPVQSAASAIINHQTLSQIAQANHQNQRRVQILKYMQERKRKYDPEKDGHISDCVCSICLDGFAADLEKEFVQLDCGKQHAFHVKCLQRWTQVSTVCPMCREQIQVVKEQQ